MLAPLELLEVAQFLVKSSDESIPGDGKIRRAISTAYYAVFHTVLQAAAHRFIGRDEAATAGYRIIYRGFEHTNIARVCRDLGKPKLSDNLQRRLGRESISSPMRRFAEAFPELQRSRNQADYDPLLDFDTLDAEQMIREATVAIDAFLPVDHSLHRDRPAVHLILEANHRRPAKMPG